MEEKLYFWLSTNKNNEDDLVYVADFETSTINCNWFMEHKKKNPDFFDSRITYWYAKLLHYQNPKRAKNFKKEYEGSCAKSFAEFLINLPKDTTIYFHNLTYDGRFLVKSIFEKWNDFFPKKQPIEPVRIVNENGFRLIGIDEQMNVENNFYRSFTNGKTYYKITLRIKNGKKIKVKKINGKWIKDKYGSSKYMIENNDGTLSEGGNYININFRCSLKMLNSSVNALSKGLSQMEQFKGLVKYKEGQDNQDFYDVEPNDDLEKFKKDNKDYVDYCKRDVEIVIQSILIFNKSISSLPTIKNYLENRKQKEKLNYVPTYNAFKQAITLGGLGRHIMGGQYVKIYQQGYHIENEQKIFDMEQFNRCNPKNVLKKDRPIGSMIIQDINEHQFFKNEIKYAEYDEDNSLSSSKFYIGGFVQFNSELQTMNEIELEDGIKLDVKSAYPFQMTKPMPYGPIFSKKEFKIKKGWTQGIDYVEWVVVKCKKIFPKENAKYCPILPNSYQHVKGHNDKEYRFVVNTQYEVVVSCCRSLWEEYQHWYEFEVEELTSYYQYLEPYLKDIALELYNVKEYVFGKKDEFGNKLYPAQQHSIKILVNSLYGSLAMRPHYPNDMLVEKDVYDFIMKNQDNKMMLSEFGKLKEFEYVGQSELFSTKKYHNVRLDIEFDIEKKKCFNASAPTLITQYQRLYLFQTIRKIGAQYFAYSDTDSIVFYNFPKEKRDEIIELSKQLPLAHLNTNLGQWEIEDLYIKSFKADKAKQYFYTTYATNKKGEFIDEHKNVVQDKHNAALIKHRKIAGGVMEDDSIDEYFLLHKEKVEDKSWTFDLFKQIYSEKGFEVDKSDYEHFMNGDLVLMEGDKHMIPTESGWLLKIGKKIIKKGKQ